MVCRRGSDPDKMLLCDNCNAGTHMFCMKPKMKTVPEGNWYCKRCVAKLGLENEQDKKNKKQQKKKRTFMVDDENSDAASVNSDVAIKPAKGRPSGSGRKSNKALQSNEIEDLLDDDNDDTLAEDDEDLKNEVEAEEQSIAEASDEENNESEEEKENDEDLDNNNDSEAESESNE